MPTTGVKFLVYVNTGTPELPVYTKVAGQRGATLNRSAETVDTTSKDSNNWRENEYGIREWSIDFDGLLIESDAAYLELEDAYMNQTKLMVRFETAAGNKYEGTALLTDFPVEGPYDGESTYSGTLMGDGAPVKTAAA
jgi:TP901-1 family phage major tail protein